MPEFLGIQSMRFLVPYGITFDAVGVFGLAQKYSRLRYLLGVKFLVICFYLGWSGSILRFRKI